ncbi:MAG: metal-dependent hydrolase [Bacteroidota bacterium]
MDSLTQIVLGAAVGEACLGKKEGNKAPMWGAIAGTIPDLDVIGNIFWGEMDALIAHRGFSHSLLFCVLAAPLLGRLIHFLYKGRGATRRQWSYLAFWAFLTHTLLDCFTTWGTQLFYPFSNARIALNSIFVVDPFYTVPFLVCVLVVLFLKRENRWRRVWNIAGILISSFYLLLTLTNKMVVGEIFTMNLHDDGKSIEQYSTYPTPLNNILWYVVAKEYKTDRYFLGQYSLLSENQHVTFTEIKGDHNLIYPHRQDPAVQTLAWVSENQFAISQQGDQWFWHDLRFGSFELGIKDSLDLMNAGFTYELLPDADTTFVEIRRMEPFSQLPNEEGAWAFFRNEIWPGFWENLKGKPQGGP